MGREQPVPLPSVHAAGAPPLGPEALPRGPAELEQPGTVNMERLFSHQDDRRCRVLAAG